MSLQQFLTRLIWWCVAPFLLLAAVMAVLQVRQAQAIFNAQARQVADDYVHALEASQRPPLSGATRRTDLAPAQLAALQQVLDELALPPQWRLRLLDNNQAVLAQRGFAQPSADDSPWRFATPHLSAPWTVALEIPGSVYRAPLLEALIKLVLGIVFATAVAVLGGRLASRSLARALDTLVSVPEADTPDSMFSEVNGIRHQLEETLHSRDQALAELAQSERTLREAQRLAKLGHWQWTPRTGVVAWSAEIYDIFGCDPHEPPLTYEAIQQRITPASWAQLAPHIEALLAQGTAYAADAELVRPDGSHRWITLRGEAAVITNGQVMEVHGTLQDITERREASERQRVSDFALQSISQGVLIADAQGKLIWVNQSFLKITGFDEAEVLGDTCHFVQGPLTDPATRQRIREASLNQTEFSGELLNYRRDGSTFWNELTIAPVFDERGQLGHFIGIVRDISERKRTQAELQQHRERLEQLVAQRTAALTQALRSSQMAHERLVTEVTHHQRTEASLQHSQLTLSQAARLAQLGAWRVDLVHPHALLNNPVSWSDEMYRLLGYTLEEVPKPNFDLFLARVHPDDQQPLRTLTLQALADKTPWHKEFRLLQTDGSVRWVVEVGEFIFDTQGAALSMHGAVKDVTEQRHTEQRLRDSEASLHQALRDARAAYYEWNIDTRVETWSDEYWALIGRTPHSVLPSREAWLASVHPDDRARVTALDESAVLQGACYELEWRVNLPDDQPARWLLDRCQPVTEPDGRLLRYRGIVVDITERKQAELSQERHLERLEARVAERTAALLQAQELQRRLNRSLRLLSQCNGAMVRATSEQQLLDDLCQLIVTTGGYRMGWVGVVEHDERKTIRMLAQAGDHANYFAVAPVSWDDTQVLGRGPMGLAVQTGETQINGDYQGPHMAPWREAALQRGYRASLALPILMNQQVWGLLALYAGESHTFGPTEVQLLEELASNIAFGLQSLRARTELNAHRLELEDRVAARTREVVTLNMALQDKARDAEVANRAKSTFLATMSHELRTPLNAVLGLTGLLAESLTERRQRDYADKIELSAKALRALIDDVLDYAKIEDGALTLEQAPFSLNATLRVAAAVVSVGVGNKPIEVVFDVAPNVPDALVGDSLRLQQILLNLCSNAVKFTQAGEIVVAVRCASLSATQATLSLSVRDTGIGIPSAQLGPIFDAFTQADQATSRIYGGTGLGLTISKRLAGLMGSHIDASSALGGGSEFCLTLTLDRASESVLPEAVDKTPQALKVLVVDDHTLARNVLRQTCAALGWQAHGVGHAEAALQALRESAAQANHYDLMLLDWRMPGTDGLALLRQAYGAPDIGLPMVVLMTSVFELELAAAASDDLVLDGITTKPVTLESLREAVTRAFSSDFSGILSTSAGVDRRLQGMRLLVADDNDINLEMMTHILAHAGAEVTTVVNGQQAVQAVQDLEPPHTDFDAVLMDIQMPVMDGYEATRQIRERLGRTDLPVIAVTAFAQPEDRDKSRRAGMVGHVVKPLDVTALLDILVKHRKPPVSKPAGPSASGVRQKTGVQAAPGDDAEVARAAAAGQSEGAATPKPLPALNLSAARKAFGGDLGPYLTLLRKFVTQHGSDAVDAARLWHSQAPPADQTVAAQRVHDLRGMAAILHAPALAHCAAATEDALRHPATPATDMTPLFEALVQAMAQLIAEVEALEGMHKDGGGPGVGL